ncbi:hypothetical protein CW304_23925 [Bacillus sp. UFRGS-B20]|nr:hypothetical protein CW304_23925 [Bacillus sp. UFRGS-B20]
MDYNEISTRNSAFRCFYLDQFDGRSYQSNNFFVNWFKNVCKLLVHNCCTIKNVCNGLKETTITFFPFAVPNIFGSGYFVLFLRSFLFLVIYYRQRTLFVN